MPLTSGDDSTVATAYTTTSGAAIVGGASGNRLTPAAQTTHDDPVEATPASEERVPRGC